MFYSLQTSQNSQLWLLFSDEVAFYVQWPEPVEQIRMRNIWSIWTKVSGHQARLFFQLSSMKFQAQLKNMQHNYELSHISICYRCLFFWSSYKFFISFASAYVAYKLGSNTTWNPSSGGGAEWGYRVAYSVANSKGVFFSESAMCFSNLQISKKIYSKKLSWTWNLNFPLKCYWWEI